VIRSQAQFRSSNEADLLPETAVAELGELLLLFVPEQSSSSLEPTSPSSGGPSGTIAAVDLSSFSIAQFMNTTLLPLLVVENAHLLLLCSPPLCTLCQCSMPWPIAPSRPCLLSCICYAPHSWEKCWHLVGLPEREMTHHCKEFQSLSACGDAKSAAGSLGARIASSLPGTCSAALLHPIYMQHLAFACGSYSFLHHHHLSFQLLTLMLMMFIGPLHAASGGWLHSQSLLVPLFSPWSPPQMML
jgi:hypothetical protein